MAKDQTQNQQTHQGTTAAQRQQIIRTADRAANNQTRTQPSRSH